MDAQTSRQDVGWPNEQALPLWLRIGFWVCIAISIAVVLRRVLALASPSSSGPPQMAGLDAVFASHTALTLAHILPALVFVLVAPLVVFRWPAHAAWPERLIFPLGAVVGLTAYAMSTEAVGGWVERSAVLLFNSLFLFSLFRAYGYKRHGEQLLKRGVERLKRGQYLRPHRVRAAGNLHGQSCDSALLAQLSH